MKKILIIAALLAGALACEPEKSTEEKMEDYMKKMLEATEKGNISEMSKIDSDFESWYKALSAEDKKKADKVGKEWATKNHAKIEDAHRKLK